MILASLELSNGRSFSGEGCVARDSKVIQPTLFDETVDGNSLSTNGFNAAEGDRHLVSLAMALNARSVAGWSPAEETLSKQLVAVKPAQLKIAKRLIEAGRDPLGSLFCRLRSTERRRSSGATYTPSTIVDAMLGWARTYPVPSRVVDPGTGSGRYLLASGRSFPDAELVGIESDPVAALVARANLATAGLQRRSKIILGDFRNVNLPEIEGRTLFIGNPPYVRHHLIESAWKKWLIVEASSRNLPASQLAGLHVHFFLATALKARPKDFGAFITAAEWLDVNYGSLVRELFLGLLGGKRITIVEPTASPFPDAATTAAITYFEVGSRAKSVRLKRVDDVSRLADLNGNRLVRRERLENERRWSHLTRATSNIPNGYIELGELCRVHRGQVTGSNEVWIAGPFSTDLPDVVLPPTVTKARELIRAGKFLADATSLRRVVDLPIDLDIFDGIERKAIDRFLQFARDRGAHRSYTAINRKAWWSVGLRTPAPILATYMARRAPAFVRNKASARHINIAHGLYPREPLGEIILDRLVDFLAGAVSINDGRTYAGGLTKFEPREMERLPIPSPALLSQMTGI